jgi:DNA-directed RNA polymerase specialized sigma24 family protein
VTDPPDFADFLQRRSRPMLRAAWLLTGGDWALAEDLAQAALGEVWRRWDRVSVMDAPDAYAHKIMINIFLRWRGRRWAAEISTERLPVRVSRLGYDLRTSRLPRQRAGGVVRGRAADLLYTAHQTGDVGRAE